MPATRYTDQNPIGTVTTLDTPHVYQGRTYEALVAFPVDHAGRPVDRSHQSGDRVADFYAGWRRFVVVSTYPELGPDRSVTHHGDWTTMHEANVFAASMGRGDKASACEVEPYLYQPSYGRVSELR